MRRMLREELRQAAHQRLDVVVARHMHAVLAMQLAGHLGAPQDRRDFLLDKFRLPFLEHEHGALARAEADDLFRYQRVDDVQRENWNAARTKRVGEAEGLQREHQAVIEPALHGDAERLFATGEDFVQSMLCDEFPRRGQPYFGLELFLPEGRRRMR